MGYSQNNEEEIIKNFFEEKELNGKHLVLLDIGANDGKTLSNSYACVLRGWEGVLVEPSKKCFEKIKQLHNLNAVEFFNVAISDKDGFSTFNESGTHAAHIYGENHGLLSSLNDDQVQIWNKESFTKTEVETWTFKKLVEKSSYKKFDLISIDAEGFDLTILKQIDLTEVDCKMLVIESNNVMGIELEMMEYCSNFGMNFHARTRENLIFVK